MLMKLAAYTCRLLPFVLALWAGEGLGSAAIADPQSCRQVRLSDIGWTDVTATTALTSQVLQDLGYQPKITVLSLPVTLAAMRDKDIDVFTGNWMPSQIKDRAPFDQDQSIEVIRANLTGAKYTLAVPDYAYAAGLHDFSDIQRFAGTLKNTIYGVEAGNDGNRHVLELIRSGADGLGGFKLIESSEQGMLAEVERAYAARRPIVFLAWEPHPMNQRFALRYLTGGASTFGPNYGGAEVFTLARAGYSRQCPNVGRLLHNLQFSLAIEDRLMGEIIDRHIPPQAAARAWLDEHPQALASWLNGVTTFDGRPATTAINTRSPVAKEGPLALITEHKLPIGPWMSNLVDLVKAHGHGVFDLISQGVHGVVDGLTTLLKAVPPLVLVAVVGLLAFAFQRSILLSLFVAAALLLILNQGYWEAMLETLSLVLFSALISTLIGVPLGVAAAHRPWLYNALHPALDLMQTLPTFVYLIPTLVLFGLGVVPGLISTVIFALPAPVRLTHLGVSSTPRPLIEAGQAFGATKAQLLFTIELPSAAPTIIAGITQCIMLSLSMVVIAALVGAGGLGVPVVRALNTVQVGMGFEAGFAIVLLAIILDRMTRPHAAR